MRSVGLNFSSGATDTWNNVLVLEQLSNSLLDTKP
jgi:hypothetical protein